jgi:hypothetical protein
MSGEVKQNTSVATGVIGAAATATQSGSNPTTSTNPESVGAEWHNTTSGQMFIATNITASENVWYGQTGITKQVNDRGVIGGGNPGGNNAGNQQNGTINTIMYQGIMTGGAMIDFGDLSLARSYLSATSNGTDDRGVWAAGCDSGFNALDRIDYVTISSPGNATDFGNARSAYGPAACSNGTTGKAVIAGGYTSSYSNTMGSISIGTPGNYSNEGTLTTAKYTCGSTSNGTNDRGLWMSGAQPSGTNSIDYRTVSSTGSASDFGDLAEASVGTSAMSNDTNDRAVMIGGSATTATDAMRAYNQYVTITSTGNATFFGYSYNCGRVKPNTFSNGTGERGVIAGGYFNTQPQTMVSQCDYITINSLGDSTSWGDIGYVNAYGNGGFSNSAG